MDEIVGWRIPMYARVAMEFKGKYDEEKENEIQKIIQIDIVTD